jgi:hypothetical protein
MLVLAPGFGPAVAWRFLTGSFMAGVYPPAMEMISTWFRGKSLESAIRVNQPPGTV